MKSIRNEQFSNPLAENQEEYETLYTNVDISNPYCPVTVCFELTDDEVEEIVKNKRIYYQQCLFRVSIENPETKELQYAPRERFHPMNIQVINPLNK